MHLNEFAADRGPLDMATADEFASLVQSATDLGLPHSPAVRYVSRNIVVNHLRLHVLEWGDPALPPVLLLHGGNQSAHSWDLVSLHLADRYHVFALDQRGHGDSEWVRDADYSAPAMARDAVAFIAQEGLDAPIIFGHSMGGMVTLTLAGQHPEIARGLVIVDVGPQVSEAGTRIIGNFVTKNREFDSIEEFIERVVRYDPFRSREHMERTARYNLIRRIDGKYISKSDRILHDESFRRVRYEHAPRLAMDDVRGIPSPTLVIRGAESNVLEPEGAEAFVRALPNGELVTVPDCAHNVHTQNTPGFLAAVQPFLTALEAARV
jgi:pimeloyl-ACP methyl ester carboxylesterase